VRLAEEGSDIIGVDICGEVGDTARFYPPATKEDLAETVRLVQRHGRKILTYTADVRDYEALRHGLDAAVAELRPAGRGGRNAGIFQFGEPVERISGTDWRDVLDVNVTGVFNTCKAAIPHLLEGGRGGSIIITSSDAGVKGFAKLRPLRNLQTRGHRTDAVVDPGAGARSIRVNVVAPTNCNRT